MIIATEQVFEGLSGHTAGIMVGLVMYNQAIKCSTLVQLSTLHHDISPALISSLN